MSVATFPLGPLSTNCYVINNGNHAIAIDVGGPPQDILVYLVKNSFTLDAILLTHSHFDHMYGVAELAKSTGAPVYAPEKDKVIAESEAGKGGIWGMPPVQAFEAIWLPLGETKFADMTCDVLETPGHTPGGVSFYFPEQKALFSGDALFYRSIGRTDFPLGNHQQLLKSIHEKLFTLPDDTIVYPGHGPSTTIGAEKKENPFCGEFVM